jgi:hypothetical protein
MFKAWFIVILLFLGSVTGFLGWLVDFAPYYSFKSAKVARATAASSTQKPGTTIVKYDEVRYEFPLRFKTDSGRDIFAVSFAPRSALDKLERDGYVNVLYLPDEPQTVLFEGDVPKMPRGYKPLLFGLASLVVAFGALKIRGTLARHTKHLGRGGDE